VYLPEQQHDEAQQNDAYDNGSNDDDDDDPECQADRPLYLNVRNHSRHRLHTHTHTHTRLGHNIGTTTNMLRWYGRVL